MSKWGGIFTRTEAKEAMRLNYQLAIVGGWHGGAKNEYARDSLANARAEGMMIATYTILNSRPGVFAVDRCKDACGDMWPHLEFVALDCEVDGITKAIIRDGEQRVKALGHRPIIYTGRWWWVGHFGNPTDFKHLPLWHSYYDKDPDVDYPRMQYGGWTLENLIGEQFQGTTIVAGQSVDKNVFIKEKLEEDEMTPEEMLNAILLLRVPIVPRGANDPVRYPQLRQILHWAFYGSHRAVYTTMYMGAGIGHKQLQEPLRAGWHAWQQVQKLTSTVAELKEQLASHAAETHGGRVNLDKVADLVNELEQGLRELDADPGAPNDE
jgi:hypothetical protein